MWDPACVSLFNTNFISTPSKINFHYQIVTISTRILLNVFHQHLVTGQDLIFITSGAKFISHFTKSFGHFLE